MSKRSSLGKAGLARLTICLLALSSAGSAQAITFNHLAAPWSGCTTLTVSSTGAIACNVAGASPIPFNFPSSGLSCPSGLAISTTTGTVTCATTLPSSCTLSAPPRPVALGGTIGLNAGCTNGAPTSYQWSATVVGSSASASVTAPTLDGAYPYSVTASNASGAGGTASALVTVGSPIGPYAYILHQDSPAPAAGVLSIIDTSTGAAINVPVGTYPQGVAFSADAKTAYVSSGDNNVVIVDAVAKSFVNSVAVGRNPLGLAVTPDGTRVYVANSADSTVSVIDALARKPASPPTIGVGANPHGVAVSPDGKHVYVTNLADDTVSMIDVSVTPNTIATVGVGSKPYGIAVSGGLVFVTSSGASTVSVIDTANANRVSTVTVGHNPIGIDVNPSSGAVYVVNSGDRTVSVIDVGGGVAGLKVTNTITVGISPSYIAFNPTGTLAYVTNGDNTISVIDVNASSASLPRITVPGGGLYAFGRFIARGAVIDYQGLWWNAQESGWGVSVAQDGSVLFAVLYTYDQAGNPIWYAMPNCRLTGTACTSDIYKVTGGTPFTLAWNGTGKQSSKVGSGTLWFADGNNATLSFAINDPAGAQTSGAKTITRQLFATGNNLPPIDYTDLWWNPNESGWGVALTHQYGTIFATLYSYDAGGNPVWYVASSCPVVNSGCAGKLYQVGNGRPLSIPWNNAKPAPTEIGTVSFAFSDASTGTMSYSLTGQTGSSPKPITRQEFASAAATQPFTTTGANTSSCNGDITVAMTSGSAVADCVADGTRLLQPCDGDVVIDTAGVVACVATKPVCTLNANPASIVSGNSSTLTASCTPTATTYLWSDTNHCLSTSATCTVSPILLTTYTVQGKNGAGASPAANATVTVTPATPSSGPQCTLTNSPGSFTPPFTDTLTATCRPAATNYAWSSNATGCSTASATCAVAPTLTTTYSVTGSILGVAGNTTSTTVVKGSVTPPPVTTVPVCSLRNDSGSFVGGFTDTLTATCDPAATTYVWSLNTNGCSTAASTCGVSPMATTTYSVIGVNSKGSGIEAVTTVTKAAVCTLNAIPTAVGAGEPSTLTVSCTPAANSYAWTSTPASFTPTTATGTVNPSTSTTYTVVGNTGTGASPSVSATVLVGTPACTLSASPASVAAGMATTLTADCSSGPLPKSYVWSETSCSSSSSTCTVIPSAAVGSSSPYSVKGHNGSGDSNPGTTSVPVTPPSCNLSASPSSISSGESSTLTASCGPPAAIYQWSKSIPAGDTPLYVTAASVSTAGTTGSIANAEWATPAVLNTNAAVGLDGSGIVGVKAATITIYQRAASAPALPTLASSYNFATRALTGLEGTAWSTTKSPAANGTSLYYSTATAVATTATSANIGSANWAVAKLAPGDTAPLPHLVFAHQRAASSPTSPPGDVTYTVASASITTPESDSLANSWTKTDTSIADLNSCSATSPTCAVKPAAATTYSVNGSKAGVTYQPALATATVSLVTANCQIKDITWPQGWTLIPGPDYTPEQTMNRGQMYAFRVVIPEGGPHWTGTIYGNVGHQISVSTNACEWTDAQRAAGCAVVGPADTLLYVSSSLTDTVPYACQLKAGETYYYNLKNTDTWNGPDNCDPGKNCTYHLFW